jgi:hypothetical protein
MRLISKKFSGVRKSKSNTAELVTTPTEGTTRFNEHAAAILGVNYNQVLSKAGARIEIATLTAEGGNGEDNKAIALLPEGSKEGNKLASPNKRTSGTLQFNGAASWSVLGGDSETNTTYSLDAENNVVDMDEDGNYLTLQDATEQGLIADGKWVDTQSYVENEGTEDEEEVVLHEAGDVAIVWYILNFVSTEAKPERKKSEVADEVDADEVEV